MGVRQAVWNVLRSWVGRAVGYVAGNVDVAWVKCVRVGDVV
jgi:hypothetical protein